MEAPSGAALPTLSEEELARLVHLKPGERFQAAPYAYDVRGRLKKAYCHIILAKDENGQRIISEAQVKTLAVNFIKSIEGMTEDEIRQTAKKSTRATPFKQTGIITITPKLHNLGEIQQASGTSFSLVELAELAYDSVKNRRVANKVWTAAGPLHKEFLALVLATKDGQLIMTRIKQALALDLEETELDLALSMLREAIRQKLENGRIDVNAVSQMAAHSTVAPTIEASKKLIEDMARQTRIKAAQKADSMGSYKAKRVNQRMPAATGVKHTKAYSAKLLPVVISELGPTDKLFEEMNSLERFEIGHDTISGEMLLRKDVYHPIEEKKGKPPRLQLITTILNQETHQAFMQLSLNEIGCSAGKGKTYFVGPQKHRKRFTLVQSTDLVYVNDDWAGEEEAAFFNVTPALRMQAFKIACYSPKHIALPVQVIFVASSTSSKQVRSFARPLASVVLLFLDMVPHLMWKYEWEEKCTLFNDQLFDYKQRSRFLLDKINLEWLKQKRVIGGHGIMQGLQEMYRRPAAQQKDPTCLVRDILLWDGPQPSAVQQGDTETSLHFPKTRKVGKRSRSFVKDSAAIEPTHKNSRLN